MTREDFQTLEIGDRVDMKYMTGIAIVVGEPTIDTHPEVHPNTVIKDHCMIEFKTGCWQKHSPMNIIRQQIEKKHKD